MIIQLFVILFLIENIKKINYKTEENEEHYLILRHLGVNATFSSKMEKSLPSPLFYSTLNKN